MLLRSKLILLSLAPHPIQCQGEVNKILYFECLIEPYQKHDCRAYLTVMNSSIANLFLLVLCRIQWTFRCIAIWTFQCIAIWYPKRYRLFPFETSGWKIKSSNTWLAKMTTKLYWVFIKIQSSFRATSLAAKCIGWFFLWNQILSPRPRQPDPISLPWRKGIASN